MRRARRKNKKYSYFSRKAFLFLALGLAQAKASENAEVVDVKEDREAKMAQSDWQGPGNDWFTPGNWTAGVATDVAGFDNANPATININGAAAAVNELLFNPGARAYTLAIGSGGSLTLSGVGLTNNSSNTQRIDINSGGTLYFNNTATATNATIAVNSGGVLDISGASSFVTIGILLGSGSIALGANELRFSGTMGTNISANISGLGGSIYRFGGTASMSFSGNNTFTGNITITAGTNTFSSTASLGNPSGVFASSGSFRLANNTVVTGFPIVLTGGSLVMVDSSRLENTTLSSTGGGSIILAGGVTGTSDTVFTLMNNISFNLNSASNLIFTIGSFSWGGTGGSISFGSNNNELRIGSANTSTAINSSMTGSNSIFTKEGTGVLTYTGNGTVTGATNITGGTLALSGSGVLATGTALSVSSGAIFDISQRSTANLTIGDVSGAGNFALGNKGFLIGANVASPNSRTISGIISNGGIGGGTGATLTKQGGGTLVLAGVNTYTGLTTISAGTLTVDVTGAIAGNATVSSGATFNMNGTFSGSTITNAGTTSIGASLGSVTITNTSTLNFTDSGTAASATVNHNGGTLNISGVTTSTNIGNLTGTSSTVSGAIVLGSKVLELAANSGNITISGAISGAGGGLTKQGSNRLTLTNSGNSYTGITTVSSGTLALSGSGILASASALENNATFDISQISAGSLTLGDVSGSGTFSLGSKSFIVGANVSGVDSRTISGVLADGGISGGTSASLTKQGTGVLILSGVNTYTGSTTISAGTLALSGNGVVTSSIANSGIFDISGINSASLSLDSLSGTGGASLGSKTLIVGATGASMTIGAISDGGVFGGTGGNLTKQGGGTLTLSDVNTYTGLTTVSAGTLTLNALGTIAGDSTVASGATFNVNGTLSGSALTNAGTTNIASVLGTITITNTNVLNFTGSGTGASATLNHNGGTLDISGVTTSASIGNLTGTGNIASGAVELGNKTLLVGALNQNATVSGIISGSAGSLTKEGSGVLTLTGVNTYSGSTTISAGTLALSTGGSIANTASLTVNAGTFDISQITPGSLSVGDVSGVGNFALGGKTFLINSGISGANSRTISGIISDGGIGGGAGGNLTKQGTGILILSGANTYTGLTTVSSGTLTLSALGTIAGNSTVSSGATFNVNGTLSGSSLNNAGATNIGSALGTITITNTNLLDFVGAGTAPNATVNHNSGILNISGVTTSAAIGNLTGTGNIASGTVVLGNKTLQVGSLNQSATISGAISGSGGSFTKEGSGVLTLTNGLNNYTGATTVSGGTLALATAGTLSASSALVVNAGAFDISQITASSFTSNDVSGAGNFNLGNKTFNIGAGVSGVGTRTISGIISDGGIGGGSGASVTKQGTGILTLTGANTYTGTTTVSSGTLALALTGTLSVNSTLVVNSSTVFDISGLTSGLLTIGDVSGAGNFALGGATFIVNGNVNGGDTRTISGNISDGGLAGGTGGVLTKDGTGVLILSGTNTYTGTTSVSLGTLTLSSSGSLAGSSVVGANGTFNVNGTLTGSSLSNAGITNIASVLGTITITNTNSLNFTGNGTGANATVNHNGGTLDISGVNSTVNIGNLTGTGSIASGNVTLGDKTLQVGGLNQSSTIAGVISGSGGNLTKQGNGTLTLTGVNTYTGATTVSTGTLALATTGRLSANSVLVANNGTVFDISQVTGGPISVGDASGAGTFALGGNTLGVGANVSGASSRTISGVISDGGIGGGTGGSLTKEGTGVLILSANNTYTGLTTVSAGTLTLNASGTIAGNSTVSSGATFNVNGTLSGSALTNAGTTNIASVLGAMTVTNTNLLNFTGNSNAANATVNHNGGSLNISGVTSSLTIGNLTGTGNIASGNVVLGNKTLALGGLNQNATIAGAISGNGGNLTKQGSGILTLTSSGNNYTGTTTISEGVLALSGSGTLASNSALVAQSGAEFSISAITAGSLTLGDVSGAGDFSIGGKNFIIGGNVNGAGTRTISGVISGVGGTLTKTGTGTLILTEENTYTGLTTVANGILQLGFSPWGGGFTVAGNVMVNPNAYLTGYGAMGGSLNNLGTVAPGNNTVGGNLTVAGNYIQGSSATFLADIDDLGVPSTLYVDGQAQLNNGIFGINMLGTGYVTEMSYVAIEANGGVVGEFGTVLQPNFVYLYVDYLPNQVMYHFSLAGPTTFLLNAANTPNQARVAEYLIATGGNAAVISALLRMRTTEQAQKFLDSFSAATYANQEVALAKVAQSFETQLADRIDGYASCYMKEFRFPEESMLEERSCKGVSWWGALYGQENEIANTDVSGLKTYSTGFALGTEIVSDENFLAGLAGSYNRLHETAFDREHAKAKGGLYQFGIYGRQQWGNLRLGSSADFGMTNTINATRDVFTTRRVVPITGNYTARILSTQIRANYDLPIAAEVGVRPLLGTIYQHVWRDEFTEDSRTGFELNVGNANYNSWRAQFGFDIELYAFEKFYPFASAVWEYEMADQYGKMVGSLVGLSEVFYALGTEIGREALAIKAGFLLTQHKEWDLLVEYEGRFAKDFVQRGLKLELSYF